MLKRKAYDRLIRWKNQDHKKALCIIGARQIGKTTIVREFAEEYYENFIEINFYEEPEAMKIFSGNLDVDTIITNLTAYTRKLMEPHKTLVLFDEIQQFPNIRTAMKFLVADGRFDYIESGSLLGVNFKEVVSFPVGFEEVYKMYPMDFEEFLWAKGYEKTNIEDMLWHMKTEKPFNEMEMKLYNSIFLDYCILGGMPAVVREYISKGTFEGTLDIQRQLLNDYREDVRKYAEGMDQTRILNVFEQIPMQLAKDNKKFQISKVARGARFKH